MSVSNREFQELLESVLDRPAGERQAFLQEACGTNTELIEKIKAMLAHEQAAKSFLAPTMTLADLLAERWQPGYRLGPYELGHNLGSGGMGTVFLARRADRSFEKKVAIKFLKPRLIDPQTRHRFAAERQIMATLNHPNIAQLHDGGTTPEGVPYLVMEYIEGSPLLEYCARQKLSITARLDLFCRICDAVAHAHRHLIVHRDIKPANILVSTGGVPKLMDFGIARILNPQLQSGQTATGWHAMSPLYASPEQVRGAPLTTASDIYSLGAVLYELCTGLLPYPTETLTATGSHALHQSVTAPSEAVRRWRHFLPVLQTGTGCQTGPKAPPFPQKSLTDLAADRGCKPLALTRALRKGLDALLLKALQKEPLNRYRSANHMADDIRRYLKGYPLKASKPNTLKTLLKFLSRHRLATATAGAALLTLLGFVIKIQNQNRHLALERDKAQKEREKAETVTAFVVDLFGVSDPGNHRGHTITAREILEIGTQKVRKSMASQPEAGAKLMHTIGEIYANMGLYPPAQDLLEQALGQRRKLFGGQHQDVAQTLLKLGQVHYMEGDYASSETVLNEVIALCSQHPEWNPLLLAEAKGSYGQILYFQGAYAKAADWFQSLLAENRARLGHNHPQIGQNLNNLAAAHLARGDLTLAEVHLRQSLQHNRAHYGDLHPLVSSTLGNLGYVLYQQGQFKTAETAMRQALAQDRQLWGKHPNVAASLNNLALLLADCNRLAEAEALFREDLEINRELLGNQHPDIASTLTNLGELYFRLGRYEASQKTMEEGLAIRRKALGDRHPETAVSLENLGMLLHAQNRFDAAQRHLQQALSINQTRLGAQHRHTAGTRLNLGLVYLGSQQWKKAEPLLASAYTTLCSQPQQDRAKWTRSLLYLGDALHREGSHKAAHWLWEAILDAGPVISPTHRLMAQLRLANKEMDITSGDEASAKNPGFEVWLHQLLWEWENRRGLANLPNPPSEPDFRQIQAMQKALAKLAKTASQMGLQQLAFRLNGAAQELGLSAPSATGLAMAAPSEWCGSQPGQ